MIRRQCTLFSLSVSFIFLFLGGVGGHLIGEVCRGFKSEGSAINTRDSTTFSVGKILEFRSFILADMSEVQQV